MGGYQEVLEWGRSGVGGVKQVMISIRFIDSYQVVS